MSERYVFLSDLRPFPEYPLGITNGELLFAVCVGAVIWVAFYCWAANIGFRMEMEGRRDGIFVVLSAFLLGPFIVAATVLVAAWVLP